MGLPRLAIGVLEVVALFGFLLGLGGIITILLPVQPTTSHPLPEYAQTYAHIHTLAHPDARMLPSTAAEMSLEWSRVFMKSSEASSLASFVLLETTASFK